MINNLLINEDRSDNLTQCQNTTEKIEIGFIHRLSKISNVQNRTLALVPQEFTLNSNRTLDPSVCLERQVGSSRLVLSGRTVGQVDAGVVTTVTVPSAEQTKTTEG